MNYKSELLKKISEYKAQVGIIGMGYVGLPLALEFAEAGFEVTGFDVDRDKVQKLNSGESYIKHIPSERIKTQVAGKKFRATNDFSSLSEMDAIIICVPTPLNKYREPDISYIENSGREISKYFNKGKLVVLESSTYPGTTEEILKPLLDKPLNSEIEGQLICGKDYFLAFSPEREDPNNPKYTTKTIPKVIGGQTP